MLFTTDAGQEAAKLRQHLAAALTRGPDTIGLLTIRSDRFSLLQNDDLLVSLVEPFNLPPMSDRLSHAIVESRIFWICRSRII